MTRRRIREEIREIAKDHLSGSTALAVRAARVLRAAAEAGALEETAEMLVKAQPRMASLRYVVRRAVEEGVFADREVLGFSERAGVRAAELIEDGMTVVTHSASAAVKSALLGAVGKGKRVRVVATESRPLMEGVRQARELARGGCEVTLIVDAAVGLFIREADLVLVGADAVSAAGVTNKAGTLLMVMAAREAGVPRYTVCGSDKFLRAGEELPAEESKPAREVLAGTRRGLEVVNMYFDTTPLTWWSGLVTEEGVRRGTGQSA